MTAPAERCWAMGNKVIFPTKADAARALPAFRADWNGHGKIIRCWPHDHFHLTKGRKIGKGKSMIRNRTERTGRPR